MSDKAGIKIKIKGEVPERVMIRVKKTRTAKRSTRRSS